MTGDIIGLQRQASYIQVPAVDLKWSDCYYRITEQ